MKAQKWDSGNFPKAKLIQADELIAELWGKWSHYVKPLKLQ